MGPHSKGDDLRAAEELAGIRTRDPLQALGRQLPTRPCARPSKPATSSSSTTSAALANESPEATLVEAPTHIFTRHVERAAPVYPQIAPGSSVRQSLNAALRHLLETEPRVLVLGEDLHDPYGGAFKVTQGLSTTFPGRVISTPISEAGVAGASIGLSLDGFLPVMEVMFADFLSLCMDQIYNHAVKFPGMFRDVAVPLVIRTPCGGRRGYGPTHSQSPEHLFTGGAGPYGRLRQSPSRCSRAPDRRRVALALPGAVPRAQAPVRRKGGFRGLPQTAAPRATSPQTSFRHCGAAQRTPTSRCVSYGGMLPIAEAAAQHLSEDEELAVEIVAPSLLSPLPKASLIRHLATRERVVVVEESHHDFGVGAEIAASMLEAGFSGKLLRIGTPPVPIASARSLERSIIPDEARLVEQVLDLF